MAIASIMGRKPNPKTPEWKKRYIAKNPTVSMVLTPEKKKLLDSIKGKRSYGKTFEEFMSGKLDPVEEFKKRVEQLENQRKRDAEINLDLHGEINELKDALSDQEEKNLELVEENSRLQDRINEVEKELRNRTVFYRCSKCGMPVIVLADAREMGYIRQCLEEKGWGHYHCLRKI